MVFEPFIMVFELFIIVFEPFIIVLNHFKRFKTLLYRVNTCYVAKYNLNGSATVGYYKYSIDGPWPRSQFYAGSKPKRIQANLRG